MKPLPVRLTRRAAAQIEEAARWWTENRPSAPQAIAEELAHAYSLIAAQPRIGAAARSRRLAGVRRLHLDRIRYHLYYREADGAIEILAFWHASRGTQPF